MPAPLEPDPGTRHVVGLDGLLARLTAHEEEPLSTAPVVELRDVGKEYRPYPRWLRFMVKSPIHEPVTALESVDLVLDPGEVCAIVGPNGAGKTTMFRIIAGLTTTDTGSARVSGLDPISDGRVVRGQIGWMSSDDRSLFLRQDCRENLWFHGRLQDIDGPELHDRIPDALRQVGLADHDDRAVFSLSAGMRARLQLARALLARPRLLVLDEPTGAVDPVAAAALIDLVRDVVQTHGLAALVSSHRLEEIEALGDRVLLLDDGRVRYDGPLDHLRDRVVQTTLEIAFREGERDTALRRLETTDATVEPHGADGVLVTLAPGDTIGALLASLGTSAAAVTQLRERTTPLSSVLAEVYERARTSGAA